MALKVELRPGERIIIGTSVITNTDQRTRLFIEGNAPVLREKDILSAATADTPARRVCLAVQLMYLGGDTHTLRQQYFELANEMVAAAPSTTVRIDQISTDILADQIYKALKSSHALIQYEQEILQNAAAGSAGLSADGKTHG